MQGSLLYTDIFFSSYFKFTVYHYNSSSFSAVSVIPFSAPYVMQMISYFNRQESSLTLFLLSKEIHTRLANTFVPLGQYISLSISFFSLVMLIPEKMVSWYVLPYQTFLFLLLHIICFSGAIFKDWLVSCFYFFPHLYGNGIFCHSASLVRNWIQSGGYEELCYWKTYDIVISTSPLDLFNSYRWHAYCKYIVGVLEACPLPYLRGYIDIGLCIFSSD